MGERSPGGTPPYTNRGVRSSEAAAAENGPDAEARADYITQTWREPFGANSSPSQTTILSWAQRELAHEKGEFKIRDWSWHAYRGRTIGPISWGERDDGSILRISGRLAQRWIDSGFPAPDNVSRLDICLTIWGCADATRAIEEATDTAQAYRAGPPGRQFGIRHVRGIGDGDTLYLGSRTSQIFLRIYDKGKESGEEQYAGSIRYEAELKQEAALAEYMAIRGAYPRPPRVRADVLGLFAARGVTVFGHESATPRLIDVPDAIVSDTERQLAWLRTQVRPTVRRLLRLGLYDDIMDSLDIGSSGLR